MLHSPFSIHLCFSLGKMKPCFVSESVTRADPQTAHFDKILNFWATIVIQIFYNLSEKSGEQSTYKLTHSSVDKDELEHKGSLGCPPCILAVSQKSFCLGNPQRQSPCEQASAAPPCLWTV